MDIIYKTPGELIPYDKNAKRHDKTQIANVAESIKQYGFRALAAKKLGMKEVPCVCVDDLTPEQVDALRIVDNKTNESLWDMGLLAEELGNVDLSAFEFDFGFGGGDYSPDDFGDDFSLPDGGKPEICQMTFTLHEQQKELIEYALSRVTDGCSETFGNTNKNGNALYEVVKQWAEQRK